MNLSREVIIWVFECYITEDWLVFDEDEKSWIQLTNEVEKEFPEVKVTGDVLDLEFWRLSSNYALRGALSAKEDDEDVLIRIFLDKKANLVKIEKEEV